MTLYALITLTLRNMNEDLDDATRQRLSPEIVELINIGYQELLVQRMKVEREEELVARQGRVQLGREPLRILRAQDENGKALDYQLEGREMAVSAEKVWVRYTFLPERLDDDEDQPDFDPSLHYILADYATYRMFLKGSRQRQARGEAFYGSYLTGVNKLAPRLPRSIVHKFGGGHG